MPKHPTLLTPGANDPCSALEYLHWFYERASNLSGGWTSHVADHLIRIVPAQALLGEPGDALARCRAYSGDLADQMLMASELSIATRVAGDTGTADAALEHVESLYGSRDQLYATSRTAPLAHHATAVLMAGDRARARSLLDDALTTIDHVNNPGETRMAPCVFYIRAGEPERGIDQFLEQGSSAVSHCAVFHEDFFAGIIALLMEASRVDLVLRLLAGIGDDFRACGVQKYALRELRRLDDLDRLDSVLEFQVNGYGELFEELFALVRTDAERHAALEGLRRALAAAGALGWNERRAILAAADVDAARTRAIVESFESFRAATGEGAELFIAMAAWGDIEGALANTAAHTSGPERARCYGEILRRAGRDGAGPVREAMDAFVAGMDNALATAEALSLQGLAEHAWSDASAKTLMAGRRLLTTAKSAGYGWDKSEVVRRMAERELDAGLPHEAVLTSKKVSGKYVRAGVLAKAVVAYGRAGDLGGARACVEQMHADDFDHIRAACDAFYAAVFPGLAYRPFQVF